MKDAIEETTDGRERIPKRARYVRALVVSFGGPSSETATNLARRMTSGRGAWDVWSIAHADPIEAAGTEPLPADTRWNPKPFVARYAYGRSANPRQASYIANVPRDGIGRVMLSRDVPSRYDLVIVDSAFGAEAASRLAAEVSLPVILAKSGGLRDVAVVASPLRDDRLPLVATALSLLGTELVGTVVHNLGEDDGTGPLTLPHSVAVASARTRRMAAERARFALEAARTLGSKLVPRIVSRPSTEDAIVEAARGAEAGFVVMGTPVTFTLRRMLLKGTATRVAERLDRSMLFVPTA